MVSSKRNLKWNISITEILIFFFHWYDLPIDTTFSLSLEYSQIGDYNTGISVVDLEFPFNAVADDISCNWNWNIENNCAE